MKNFSLFFSLLFVALSSISTIAQPWYQQQVAGLPNSVNPTVTFSAVDDNVCWGINYNNSQFLRTTNGGTNWTVSTVTGATGLHGSCISALDVNIAWVAMNDPSNATSGGIFKTTDGGSTWAKQSTAFPGSGGYPNDIHFFDSNNGVVIGASHNGNWEIYTTTNGGSQWTQVDFANIPPPAANEFTGDGFFASAGNCIWFGTWAGGYSVYRSTNRGLTWSATRNLPGQSSFCVAFKDSLNGISTNCFGGVGNRIARTTDGGVTWTLLSNVPTQPSTYFISYVKGTQGSYVITSISNIGLPESTIPGSAYSNDDGSSWAHVDDLPHEKAAFSSWNIGWSGGLNDIIYKWNSNILPVELTSFTANTIGSNVELTWQTATEINNKGFAIYRNGKKISFIDGKGTTTEKQDYSFVDKNLQSGIYNYRLNQIDFDGTQEVVGELTVNLSLPEQFSLEQNYPNPFNPSTTIRYSIPASEFVTLKIYDVLGNEVASLVNEEKPAGTYEVEFNSHSDEGQNLSSGFYFYKMQAGSYTQTKKLILMK